MTVSQRLELEHQADLERIKNFRLLDDDFFTKCFEGDTKCIELVLRIVLNKSDLYVVDVRTQVFVENIKNRSVRLDVLATDSEERKFNVEIQRADKGAGKKRARYNSSMLDANLLKKGEDFENLPETFVVFITENDVIGKRKALYPVGRCFLDTGEIFDDGSRIIYVNGSYRDETPIGKLMHDFSCKDPSDMHYSLLADRARFFKESKEGVAIMCKAMEDMRDQAYNEGRSEGRMEERISMVIQMLKAGKFDLNDIAALSGMSIEELEKLKADKTA